MAGRRRDWTERDEKVIREMLEDGYTLRAIGERLNRSSGAISSKIRNMGLEYKRPSSGEKIIGKLRKSHPSSKKFNGSIRDGHKKK